MVEYHAADSHKITDTRSRRETKSVIALAVAVLALFVGALFVTGFLSAGVEEAGDLPNLKTSLAAEERLPGAEIRSKSELVQDRHLPAGAKAALGRSDHHD